MIKPQTFIKKIIICITQPKYDDKI